MRMKFIDCEHHFYDKAFVEWVKQRTEYPYYKDGFLFYSKIRGFPMDIPVLNYKRTAAEMLVDLDDFRLAIMDEADVDTGVISSVGGIEELPKEDAVKLARMTNDTVAAACGRHPNRFMGTICLPTIHVEESIKELERAVKELGLKYWHTNSNYRNEYLYMPKFEPILAKCAELDIPFYVHPHYPSVPYLLENGPAMSSAGFGFGVDVMRTIIALILGGIFDRYPNLRMILGHMAEFIPYCLDRMDNRFSTWRGIDPVVRSKGTFHDYFKNMNIFMTTSGIHDPAVVKCAMEVIGVDNILFGTDYPFEEFKASADFIRNLPISDLDKEKIAHLNVEKYILK